MKVKQVGGNLEFQCPGCNETHAVNSRWTWNGSVDLPTFSPSVLLTTGHFCSEWKQGDNCWCTYNDEHPDKLAPFSCARCHSFVVDGKIQFLADCTHKLAGQTVELPDFKEE